MREEILLIGYGFLLGTLGNILYRIRNELSLSPILVRALMGLFSTFIYIAVKIYVLKQEVKFDATEQGTVFIIGYFLEILIEVLEEKLPQLLRSKLGGNDNAEIDK